MTEDDDCDTAANAGPDVGPMGRRNDLPNGRPYGDRSRPGQLRRAVRLQRAAVPAHPGFDRTRVLRPVVVGDTVHAVVEVLGTRATSSGGNGVVTTPVQVLNQRDER